MTKLHKLPNTTSIHKAFVELCEFKTFLEQFNPNLVLKMTNFTKHMAKLNQIVHLIFGKNILDHGLISMFGLVGNSLLYLYIDARRFRKRDEHIFIASSYRFWLCEFLHGENEIYEFSCCNENNQKHFELEIQFFSTGSFRQNSAINKLKNAEFCAHFQSDTHFIGIRQSILTTDWHIFCFLC